MVYIAVFAIATVLFFMLSDPLNLRCVDTSDLYVCKEDGDKSALYLRRTRTVEYAIVFKVEEFMRITCAKGQAYTKAQSDWFKNVSYADGVSPLVTFVKLPKEQAQVLLNEQKPITRAVHRGLARMDKKGTRKPNDSFGIFA